MATKKRPRTASSVQPLGRLQAAMRGLQPDADKLLKQTRKRTRTLIRRDGEEALDRVLGQARRLRKDLEKRAQRASKDLETRAEKFRSALEKEVGRRLSSVLHRLELPSRSEIQRLSRRVGDLEKKVRARAAARPAKAVRKPQPKAALKARVHAAPSVGAGEGALASES